MFSSIHLVSVAWPVSQELTSSDSGSEISEISEFEEHQVPTFIEDLAVARLHTKTWKGLHRAAIPLRTKYCRTLRRCFPRSPEEPITCLLNVI